MFFVTVVLQNRVNSISYCVCQFWNDRACEQFTKYWAINLFSHFYLIRAVWISYWINYSEIGINLVSITLFSLILLLMSVIELYWLFRHSLAICGFSLVGSFTKKIAFTRLVSGVLRYHGFVSRAQTWIISRLYHQKTFSRRIKLSGLLCILSKKFMNSLLGSTKNVLEPFQTKKVPCAG